MSSMVSEYIIRPALQQVRRFSRSSAASEAEPPSSPYTKPRERRPSHDDAISETEEDLYLRDHEDESADTGASASSSPSDSSRSSVARRTADDTRDRSSPVLSHHTASRPPHGAAPRDPGRTAPVSLLTTQISGASGADAMDMPPSRPEGLAAGAPGTAAVPLEPTDTVVDPHVPLPEDDGMGVLRRKIIDIQDRKLPAPEQARLVHQLLMESYKKSHLEPELERPESPSSVVSQEKKQAHAQTRLDPFKLWHDFLGDVEEEPYEKFVLTQDDVNPTYAPLAPDEEDSEYRVLGCDHYKRNVKSQCVTCSRWYTCRFCHDAAESHVMAAKDTKNMLCMFCGTAQRAGEVCIECSEPAAMYHCSICKLWNNDPDRSVYHCPDCGICRVGMGLGKDYFHCKTCNACLSISLENDHRCIERLLDCDCPICGEYMFNSPRGICHMKCGHTLHKDCWSEHIKHAYKCPICSKSIVNMETQFRRLDLAIEAQPMPEKFQDTRAVVTCNDCSAKTTVKYHWLGLKCAVCQSYNTSQLQILGSEADALQRAVPVVPEALLSETVEDESSDLVQPTQTPIARDIPRRRRHSSNLVQATGVPDTNRLHIGSFVVQDRLARSVSPVAALNQHPGDADDSDDDEAKEDMIGFWRRMRRNTASGDELDDEEDSEDESDSSLDDDMDDDDEDEEEDEINIFGHR